MYKENRNCLKTYVSFRISSETVFDPDIITARLGLIPDTAGMKGTKMERIIRTNEILLWPRSIWIISTAGILTSTNLEEHIALLLDTLEPIEKEFFSTVKEYNLKYDFFAYWESKFGHGGPEFSPRLLQRISSIGAELGIDFYYWGSENEEPDDVRITG